MTEPLNGGVQPTGQPPDGGQGQGQGQGDPAGQYAGYLRGVPEQFHGQLLDGFKRTDGHWQKQLQDVQSRYQPYEEILSAYQPDQLTAATDLLSALRADPAAAVAELQAALGLDQEGQGGPAQGETYDDGQQFQLPQEYTQRLDQMEQLLTVLAQQTIDSRNEQQTEVQVNGLDDELRQAFGDGYDELDDRSWHALLGLLEHEDAKTPAEAVSMFREWTGQLGGGRGNGASPVVMPSGGGMPSNQVDPRTLYADKGGRRAAALAMLQEAAQANQ